MRGKHRNGTQVAKQVPPIPILPVLVCSASHCRGGAQRRLREALCDAGVEVLTTGCLGVCKGPVAMLPIGDRWEVVSRVRGKDARARVVDAMTRQRQKALRKRAVRGSRRRKAIARGTTRLARLARRGRAVTPALR